MPTADRSDANETLFVTYTGEATLSYSLVSEFIAEPLSYLAAAPAVMSVDVFRPETGDIPLFDDGVGPPLIAQIDVESEAGAEELIADSGFSDLILRSADAGAPGVFLDCFRTVHFPLSRDSKPGPRTATLSFVVRYYRPVTSESEFISAYLGHHPPAMRGFPGIRNIICYVPVRLATAEGIPDSGAFFGNEVVFDDLAALNGALASDVLEELKQGRRESFPVARCTHYAMRRERAYSRPSGRPSGAFDDDEP